MIAYRYARQKLYGMKDLGFNMIGGMKICQSNQTDGKFKKKTTENQDDTLKTSNYLIVYVWYIAL